MYTRLMPKAEATTRSATSGCSAPEVASDERGDGDRQPHHREEDDHVQVEGDPARGQLQRADPADDHHEQREGGHLERVLEPGRHPEANEPRDEPRLRPPARERPVRQAVPALQHQRQVDGRSGHLRQHRAECRARDAQLGEAGLAEDQHVVEHHVDQRDQHVHVAGSRASRRAPRRRSRASPSGSRGRRPASACGRTRPRSGAAAGRGAPGRSRAPRAGSAAR